MKKTHPDSSKSAMNGVKALAKETVGMFYLNHADLAARFSVVSFSETARILQPWSDTRLGKEGPLSSGSGRRHAWDSRPTGRYRNLGSSFIWGLQHGTTEKPPPRCQCVAGANTAYMATACDHTTATRDVRSV